MKISIVTSCFNVASTIVDTLHSIDAQTFANREHWIIDGGSTDGTLELAPPSEKRHVLSEPDTGVYNAMNKGISRAGGDIIGFLNADDFYESDRVLGWVAEAFEDPGVDLVYGNLRYVDFSDTDKVVRDWKSEPHESGMFRRGWMPPHPTVYARRKLFDRFGGFDESFDICADWEWLYRMFEVNKVRTRHIEEYLVRMRLGGVSNRSWSNVLRSNRQAAQAFRKHGARVPLSFYPGKLVHRLKQFR